MYLGVAPQSGEHFVGTWNGDVSRTRFTVRIVESLRWDTDFLVILKGAPSRPIPSGVDRSGRVEECEDPHAMIEVDPEKHAQQKFDHEVHKRTRIMRADLDKYGYTDGYPRCEAIQAGSHATDKNHTEWCRIRIYGERKQAGDPKRLRLSKEFKESYPHEKVQAHNVDIENEHESDMPVPVPEGPMPSHIPSDHDHVVSENGYEPNNSNTKSYTGHGMDQDEGEIADMFLDDNYDMGDIEENQMRSTLIVAGTDRHSTQIFTNTICALKTGPTSVGGLWSRSHHG